MPSQTRPPRIAVPEPARTRRHARASPPTDFDSILGGGEDSSQGSGRRRRRRRVEDKDGARDSTRDHVNNRGEDRKHHGSPRHAHRPTDLEGSRSRDPHVRSPSRHHRRHHRHRDPERTVSPQSTHNNSHLSLDVRQRDLVNRQVEARHVQAEHVRSAQAHANAAKKASWLGKLKKSAGRLVNECVASFQTGSEAIAAAAPQDLHRISDPVGIAVLSTYGQNAVGKAAAATDRPPAVPPKASSRPAEKAQSTWDYKVFVATANVDVFPPAGADPCPHPPCTAWPQVHMYELGEGDAPTADCTIPSNTRPGRAHVTREPEVPEAERCQYCHRRAERYQLLCETCRSLGFTPMERQPFAPADLASYNERLNNLASSADLVPAPLRGSTADQYLPRPASPRRQSDLTPPLTTMYQRAARPVGQQPDVTTAPPLYTRRTASPRRVAILNTSNNPASATNPPRRRDRSSSSSVEDAQSRAAPQGNARYAPPATTADAAARYSVRGNPFVNPFDGDSSVCSTPLPLEPPRRSRLLGRDLTQNVCARRGVSTTLATTHVPHRHASLHGEIEDMLSDMSRTPSPPLSPSPPSPQLRHVLSSSSLEGAAPPPPKPGAKPQRTTRKKTAARPAPLSIPPVPQSLQSSSAEAPSEPPSPSSVYSRATRCFSRPPSDPQQEDVRALHDLLRWEDGHGWDQALKSAYLGNPPVLTRRDSRVW